MEKRWIKLQIKKLDYKAKLKVPYLKLVKHKLT